VVEKVYPISHPYGVVSPLKICVPEKRIGNGRQEKVKAVFWVAVFDWSRAIKTESIAAKELEKAIRESSIPMAQQGGAGGQKEQEGR